MYELNHEVSQSLNDIEMQNCQRQIEELKKLNEKLMMENSERRAVARALLRAESRYRDIFDNAVEAIFQWTPSWHLLSANRSCARMFGFATVNEMMDETAFGGFVLCHDAEICARLINELESRGGVANFEFQLRMRNGEPLWVNLNARRVAGLLEKNSYYEGFMEDISERYDAQKKLEYQAFHDTLTGLANRALFTDRLQLALSRFLRNKANHFAVLFLDLDNFKMVNDTYGHAVGDMVLRHAGKMMRACVREHDTVARFGCDEFGVILEGFDSADFVINVAERIRECMVTPLTIADHAIHFGVSIGIVLGAKKYTNIDDILRDVDTAMYKAKFEPAHYYQVFTGELEAETMAKVRMNKELHKAEEKGEFEVLFQPIVELPSKKVTALEGVLVWNRGGDVLLPAEYMPLAESIGMAGRLNSIRLKNIFSKMVNWEKKYGSCFPMHVRMSKKQLLHMDCIKMIEELIKSTGVNPKQLYLEIHDMDLLSPQGDVVARNTIEKLHELGIQICFGNFGGAVAAISILQDLPVAKLKSYGVIMEKSIADQRAVAILGALTQLGRDVGIDVIIDGVNTQEHFDLIKNIPYCYGQGNYFASLLSAELVEKYLG